MAVHCAATDAWLRYRRVTRQQVWGEATNVRDLVHLGFRGIPDCLWYNEGLVPADLKGYVCATTEVDVHEAVLCWSVDRGERWSVQQEEGMALLQVLHPALQAGHRAFATLAARQAAVVASLDAVSEALLVVGPDGRERHRNAALARLLAAEPERERVLAALRDAAGALTAAQAGAGALSLLLPSARTAGERRVVTATARYAVSASYGSEALWGDAGGRGGVADARARRRRRGAGGGGRARRRAARVGALDARVHGARGGGRPAARAPHDQRRAGGDARRQRAHGAAPHRAGHAEARRAEPARDRVGAARARARLSALGRGAPGTRPGRRWRCQYVPPSFGIRFWRLHGVAANDDARPSGATLAFAALVHHVTAALCCMGVQQTFPVRDSRADQ
jgi:hypothetical protein